MNELATPPPSSEVDEREKKQNASIREMAFYNKAASLTQMPVADEAKRNRMREMAIETYEELVKNYPRGESAPAALIQVGTINMMMKKTEKKL